MDYEGYYFRDNPFPKNAGLNVSSEDPRNNGTIFFEDIFIKELTKLRQGVESRTNLIYVAGLQFDRGVGKSAILSHVWRHLGPEFFTAFIRCTEMAPSNKPSGFCTSIIAQLHRQGHIWTAFWKLMLEFADQRNSLTFKREAIQMLQKAYPKPVEELPLTLFTHVADPAKLAGEASSWLQRTYNCNEHLSKVITHCYFTRPEEFPDRVTKTRGADPIQTFGDLLILIRAGGFDYGYFFLDQFEDSIMSASTSKMGEFSVGMRRMLEMSAANATLIVTLHPDSEQKLNSNPAAQNLQTLAPIDEKRYISLNVIDPRSDLVVPLAVEYMRQFRSREPPTETFPLDPIAIRYVCFLKRGNIRYLLQQLHECIEYGATHGNRTIDMKFIQQNHSMTMGSELNEERYHEFQKLIES